jgi:hypothetical protein
MNKKILILGRPELAECAILTTDGVLRALNYPDFCPG